MILQISIANFRSIDQELIMNLYTRGYQGGHQDNVADLSGVPYRGLKTVGIYGANGSGKSNFLRAVSFLAGMVSDSYKCQDGDEIIQFDPCLFRSKKKNQTSIAIEFTIPTSTNEQHYVYKVKFDKKQIYEETLMLRVGTKRPVRIFVRNAACEVKYGDMVKGRKAQIVPFRNQLFLSVAGHRAESPDIILRVASYIRQRFITIYPKSMANYHIDDNIVALLVALKYIDVGVADVGYQKENIIDILRKRTPSSLSSATFAKFQNYSTNVLKISHQTSTGELGKLDLEDESDGTKRFAMFLPAVANALLSGGVLLYDELETQMHPFLAEAIVKLFNDPRINKGQAQLIYTTHCSNLLSEELLRRDQIWFTEKIDCRTHLFSLDDFDKRRVTPTSPYVKWYLEGRFGGVPTIDYGALVEHFQKLQAER